jgi:1-deoxy-D-xylulose-5-phosphate synthase
MIIILNENGMSISTNKGAFASYLSRVRMSGRYRNLKSRTQGFLGKIPLLGRPLRFVISKIKNATKNVIYKPNYFELLGLYYVGPVDGNNYNKLCDALENAKQTGKTCVLHVKTQKGRGYSPAETSPDDYHSVSSSKQADSYHSVMGDKLASMAEVDDKIVAVTAAMGIGTGLNVFGEKYPDRYYDVGIAEAHAMTFSAALAVGGLKPYIGIYSTFMQRCYDNILHDVCLQRLPVRMLIDRAGLAPGDGATHHGIFDVSFLSHIPEMTILAPASYSSLIDMLDMTADFDGPIAIRYPNAAENPSAMEGMKKVSCNGGCRVFADFDSSPEYVFITYGHLLPRVRGAENILRDKGYSVGVILVESLKPYGPTAEAIMRLTQGATRILYAEEGIRAGGAAEITRGELIRLGLDLNKIDYRIAAIEDNFASPKELCDLYDYVGLSAEKLADHMLK